MKSPSHSQLRAAAFALLMVGLIAAMPGATHAQTDDPDLPVFGEIIDVRVINFEVVVTDRTGERVRGLQAADFRLVVDGEEVPLEYFTEIIGGTAVDVQDPSLQAVPAIRPGSPVSTSYLVFIDDFFSIRRDRNVVLKSLIEDLQFVGPEDRMAIVSYDGQRVEMLTTWTNSPETLERVLREALDRPSKGLQRLAERRRFDFDAVLSASFDFRDELDAGAPSGPDSLDSFLNIEERFYASLLASQVKRSVGAAAASLRGFAFPPGRKVMLLLSGGWPFLPAEFVVADLTRPLIEQNVTESGDALFRPLTDTANQLGYTIYPIDVPGLDRRDDDLVTIAGPPPTGTPPGSAFLREQEMHYSLRFIAEQTGGEPFLNADRRLAFREAVEDTRSYYWLGFTPSWNEDDERHDVRIEVRDPKLRVRARTGFLDFSRQRQTTMQVESQLLFGNPPRDNPLALSFGRPEKAGLGKMMVPLKVGIPLDAVTFLPAAGGKMVAQMELRVAVVDERGVPADIPVIPLVLTYDGEPPPGEIATYETALRMRRENHAAVVSVYDKTGGTMLSGTAEIAP